MADGWTVKRIFRLLAAVIAGSAVTGCTSISYYAQSLEGHVKIMAARENVGKLIHDPATPEPLRAKLTSASTIRRFATDELALPENNSYRSYVDIGREAVTWAVFAAPQFSLAPRTWCFPVFAAFRTVVILIGNLRLKAPMSFMERGWTVNRRAKLTP